MEDLVKIALSGQISEIEKTHHAQEILVGSILIRNTFPMSGTKWLQRGFRETTKVFRSTPHSLVGEIIKFVQELEAEAPPKETKNMLISVVGSGSYIVRVIYSLDV